MFSRDSETRTLVPELVTKDLKSLKKAENKKEEKTQELRSQLISILKEAQPYSRGTASSTSVSSGLASSIS